MKLSSSTGDFYNVSDQNAERIACYEGTGFRYLNVSMYRDAKPDKPLGQDGDGWQRMFADIGEAAAKLGITLIMGHAPGELRHYKEGEERSMYIRAVNRCIEGFASLGVRDVVVHPAWAQEFDKHRLYKENREFYGQLLPAAEKFGVNILAENNFYNNALLSTGYDMLELLEVVNHPLLHVCWDTGHARLMKVNQYESIKALGGELRGLHIADNEGYWDRHTAPFFGTINFDPIMQALVDIGYKGYFNFEADWVLRQDGREPWYYHGQLVTRLAVPPRHLSQQAVRMVYEVGVYMLSSYGVYEE